MLGLLALSIYAAIATTYVLLTVVPRKKHMAVLNERINSLITAVDERFDTVGDEIKAIYFSPEDRKLLGLELPEVLTGSKEDIAEIQHIQLVEGHVTECKPGHHVLSVATPDTARLKRNAHRGREYWDRETRSHKREVLVRTCGRCGLRLLEDRVGSNEYNTRD